MQDQELAVEGKDPHSFSYGKPDMTVGQEIAFVLVIMSAQLFTQVGVGQGVAPIEIVARHFGDVDPGVKAWNVAAYSLTVGTFILAAGRIGDMYGHKLSFILGYVWYSLWSLLAGLSNYIHHSSIFFNLCRGMQGIGPAVLMPNALAILGRVYHVPGRRKHLAFALFGCCAPSGFLFGALFSSLLTQLASWPWSYYIMAIACIILAALAALAIPPDVGYKEYRQNETFDYFGAFFGISGLILINCAWNQSPIDGWEKPYVYVLLIVGVCCLVAFCVVETKFASQPLVPLSKFNAVITRTLASVACGWATFGIWIFYIFQFWENLQGNTPLSASVQFIPSSLSGFCASMFTGMVIGKIPTSVVMMISMLAFCIACVLLAPMPIHLTYWALSFVSTLIACWGMDISFPAATILLSYYFPREHQGIAASLVSTAVNYSVSIGLGIAGTVQRYTVPRAATNPSDIELQLKSYRSAFYTGVGLSGLGIAITFYSVIQELNVKRRKNIS